MSGIPVVAASSFTYQEPEEMSRVVKELHGTTVGDGDVVEEIGANCQQFMSVTGHSMSGVSRDLRAASSGQLLPACSIAGVRVELQSYQCGGAKEGGGNDRIFTPVL